VFNHGNPISVGATQSINSLDIFDVEDVEYVRHQNKPLLARMFKARGQGPFPAVVELHGGA
jgi:hypothetical protein